MSGFSIPGTRSRVQPGNSGSASSWAGKKRGTTKRAGITEKSRLPTTTRGCRALVPPPLPTPNWLRRFLAQELWDANAKSLRLG